MKIDQVPKTYKPETYKKQLENLRKRRPVVTNPATEAYSFGGILAEIMEGQCHGD